MKKHSGTCSACGKETTVYENPTGEELCKPCVLESVKHGGEDFGPGEKAEYLTDILGADYKAKGFAGMTVKIKQKLATSGSIEGIEKLIKEYYGGERKTLIEREGYWEIQSNGRTLSTVVVQQGKKFIFGVPEALPTFAGMITKKSAPKPAHIPGTVILQPGELPKPGDWWKDHNGFVEVCVKATSAGIEVVRDYHGTHTYRTIDPEYLTSAWRVNRK